MKSGDDDFCNAIHKQPVPRKKTEVLTGQHEMSYPKWCSLLIPSVLKSRTPFACFLAVTLSLHRRFDDLNPSTPAFFPVPVTVFGHNCRMPKACSSYKRRELHLQRAVHTVSMALNFWNYGGKQPPEHLLWREPNAEHRALFTRIRSLIRSDGLAGSFLMSKSGRKSPELIARLSELSTLLTSGGIGNTSYEKAFPGIEVPKDPCCAPEVNPFTDLVADRIQVFGRGHWDITDFIDDHMKMAYRDPDSLLANLPLGPHPAIRDSPEEVAKLALKWDENDLLYLRREPIIQGSLVKIFNSYKGPLQDRQIGDRRGRNSLECKVCGPSKDLPAGADVCELQVPVQTHKAVISISDRKDYYHQVWCSKRRAAANAVGPGVPLSLLEGSKAFGLFLLEDARSKRRRPREVVGDDLDDAVEEEPYAFEHLPGDCAWVSFKSILQGDHCGVELATSAHQSLLRSYGLLEDSTTLMASRPLRDNSLLQGLVIDDYFAVSVEPNGVDNSESRARRCYDRAQEAYAATDLLGSPSKDVLGDNSGKIIGAFINSEPSTLARGLCTAGAPPQKRVSLSFITLAMCRLTHTTDVLFLCLLGGWVSVLSFRRPLMQILNKSFHLVNQNSVDQNKPQLIKLPRAVASELVLLAVLIPLAVCDLGAEYLDRIFCTDASNEMGAICSAPISREIAQALWRTCRSKGSYSRLLSPAEVILKRCGVLEEKDPNVPVISIDRPLACNYDFLEVYAGAATITRQMDFLGYCCGPPIDLSNSEEFNLMWPHVLEWISSLVSSGRLRSFFVSPPCTTFSIMRRPRLRSASSPFGFDTSDPQTRTGTILACRGCQLMYVGATNDVPGIMETPFSAYTKHLPQWQIVRQLPCADETRTDSCQFGSIHLKSFRFLGVHVDLELVKVRCNGGHEHVPIQGVFTKASATHAPKLAESLAKVLSGAIEAKKLKLGAEADVEVGGLENQLVNEVAMTSKWQVDHSWNFAPGSHINLLEENSVLRLLKRLAKLKKPVRIVNLVDSFVVRGATAKGRSSSRCLSSVLRKVSAQPAIYLTMPFVPTRLNASDDPTRSTVLRPPTEGLDLDLWEEEDLYKLSALGKFKKWASNWVRLVLRLKGPCCLDWSDRSIYRHSDRWTCPHSLRKVDFDSTLGYPGEGPSKCLTPKSCLTAFCFVFIFALAPPQLSGPEVSVGFNLWLFCSLVPSAFPVGGLLGAGGFSFCWVLLLNSFTCAEAMPTFPVTPGDRLRAQARANRPPVPSGRPVTGLTLTRRQRCWETFLQWAVGHDIDFAFLLDQHQIFIDDINLILERFGRDLYKEGKPYAHFAETLNHITTLKPAIRRQLQGAWSFGFSWVKHEPSTHHVAMPGPMCLACIATSLIWGWVRFAGVIALMWSGLLRPGELLAAERRDLLLPSDGDETLRFGLISIRDPKTRFTNARHQSVKLDMEDLLRVIELALAPLQPHQRLWPFSGQTLRSRFQSVLRALQLPEQVYNGVRPLELASIRAGAATWIMSTMESGDLLQRRGRWANRKMMDIYVQEVTALLFLQQMPSGTKQTVIQVASSLLEVLHRAEQMVRANIPTNVWSILFMS